MTIASAVESNQELDDLETRHVCPERALSEMAAQSNREPHNVQVNTISLNGQHHRA
jgi:hypothetical protein